MNLFFWKEKRLRTVWRVEKNGKKSFLVGTAHFSPYSFRKAMAGLVEESETVIFEGPLDPESMAVVAQYGFRGEGTPSVYDALAPAVIREINRQMAARSGSAPRSQRFPQATRR